MIGDFVLDWICALILPTNGLIHFVTIIIGKLHRSRIYDIHIYIYICIWSPPHRGAIRAHGAVVIILDNYILNMITCSKTCILNAYDFKYSDISKRKKHQFPENRICFFEKGQIYLQIVNPLHEKCT